MQKEGVNNGYLCKCSTCGKLFNVFDRKCPNCHNKNSNVLFNFLNSNDFIDFILKSPVLLFSLPGAIIYLISILFDLLLTVFVFFVPLLSFISIFQKIFGFSPISDDFPQIVNNFYLSNILSIIIFIVIFFIGFILKLSFHKILSKKFIIDNSKYSDKVYAVFLTWLSFVLIIYRHLSFRMIQKRYIMMYDAAQFCIDNQYVSNDSSNEDCINYLVLNDEIKLKMFASIKKSNYKHAKLLEQTITQLGYIEKLRSDKYSNLESGKLLVYLYKNKYIGKNQYGYMLLNNNEIL